MLLHRVVRRVARPFLSPREQVALDQFFSERQISLYHQQGLRQIRQQTLSRPNKLNLGSGSVRKAGFLNVDLVPGGDVTLDISTGLPFESDCCEMIFSEHCFEHFEYPEPIGLVFRECLRVLKPGGTFKFSVPDTEWPLHDYSVGPDAPYFAACREHAWHPSCTTRAEHINFHFRQGTEHRYAWDFETARKALNAAGFADVARGEFDPSLDAEHRRVGSLFVVARKPQAKG
jgi:predicted SAM-dependent methyltransferase